MIHVQYINQEKFVIQLMVVHGLMILNVHNLHNVQIIQFNIPEMQNGAI
jgi:hypothetical protein